MAERAPVRLLRAARAERDWREQPNEMVRRRACSGHPQRAVQSGGTEVAVLPVIVARRGAAARSATAVAPVVATVTVTTQELRDPVQGKHHL